jgi:hypothetical protein
MNADSNRPSVVASNDSTGFVCLADSTRYQTLDDRRRVLLKYWYALATVPFFLSIVIGVGVFPRLVLILRSGQGLQKPLYLAHWVGHSLLFFMLCLSTYVGFSSAVRGAVGVLVWVTAAAHAAFRELETVFARKGLTKLRTPGKSRYRPRFDRFSR